jgi:hypothetical protein
LNTKWAKQAVAYNSFSVDGFPNLFITAGPNIALSNGSLILMFEKVVEYAAKAIKKMQREGIKVMVVKKEAVDDFKEYCDNFFPKTVFATKVRSFETNLILVSFMVQGWSRIWPRDSLMAGIMSPRNICFRKSPLGRLRLRDVP